MRVAIRVPCAVSSDTTGRDGRFGNTITLWEIREAPWRVYVEMLWCWRCRDVMPMLDEQEWEAVQTAHRTARENVKEYRRATGTPLPSVPDSVRAAYYEPVLAEYEALTGFRETNPNAIWHHRIALYGPPCGECGKPLRTDKAKLCAACGWHRPVA